MFKVPFGLWQFGVALVAAAAHVTAFGGDVVKSRVPYLVNLHKVASQVACGGVLISPRIVLTSSRCTRYYDVRFATMGATILGENEVERFKIVRVVPHPSANLWRTPFDLAVVVLDRWSTFAPVQFDWDSDLTAPGMDVLVRGFGYDLIEPSLPLKEARVTIWDKDKCQDAYPDETNSTFCVGGDAEKVCVGDWGGPLVVPRPDGQDTLVGVVGRISRCGSATFAQIQPAREFLEPFLAERTTRPHTTSPPQPTTPPPTNAPPTDDPPLTDEPRPSRPPPMESVQAKAVSSDVEGVSSRSIVKSTD